MSKKWTAKQREAYQIRLANEYNVTLQHIYQSLKELGAESYYTTKQYKGNIVRREHLNVQDIVQHNVLNVKRIEKPTKEHLKQLKSFLKDNKKMTNAIYKEFLRKQKTQRYLTPGTEEYQEHEKLLQTVAMYKTIKDIKQKTKKIKETTLSEEVHKTLNEVETALEIIARFITDMEIMVRDVRQEINSGNNGDKYRVKTKRRLNHASNTVKIFRKYKETIDNKSTWSLIIQRAFMLEKIVIEYGRPNTKYMIYYDNADADSVPYVEIEEKLNNIINTQEVITQSLTHKSTKEENEQFMKKWTKEIRKNMHGLV